MLEGCGKEYSTTILGQKEKENNKNWMWNLSIRINSKIPIANKVLSPRHKPTTVRNKQANSPSVKR